MSSRKSTSKRKSTSSSKRKTTSSKQKLKWFSATDLLKQSKVVLFDLTDYEVEIELIDKEHSKINLLKKHKGDLKYYLKHTFVDKFLFLDRMDEWCFSQNIIVAKTHDGTYLYWCVEFSSEGTIDYYGAEEIQTDIYECKTWSALYKKLPTYLKREIEQGLHGNIIDGNTGNEYRLKWKKTSPAPLKKLVKEWFDLESVKDYAAKKKLKKYDIATQRKKQISALTGVEKFVHAPFAKRGYDFELIILAKRKDGKYVYLHNLLSKKSKGIESEMNVTLFDTWEKLWNKLPSSIRREIK